MRTVLSRFAIAFLLAPVTFSATLEETIALGRKALGNEGVSTAWRLSQKALLEAPQSAAAHEFAGEVSFRRGEFTQAEAEFKQATKLDPNYARAWWGLARVAACTSMDKTADQYFRRAHELDPRDPKLYLDWAMRLRGGEHIDALETYVSMADPDRNSQELEALRQHIRMDKALRGRKLWLLKSAYQRTDIPLIPFLTANHTRTFGVEVEINGATLRLVLDTGAGGIVIQRSAADRAGIASIADASLNGFGDNMKLRSGYIGLADRVRIGSVEFGDALVQVSNQTFEDIQDGLIGTNVFSEFLVTLDFAGRKVHLDPLNGYQPGTAESIDASTPGDAAGWARVYQFGHMLLIPTRVGESRDALFAIDTGAARTLISYDLAAEVSKLNREDKTGLRGINGQVTDVYQAGNLYLQFAGFRQRNMAMTSFDMWPQSKNLGTEVSGFLGLPVLSLFTLTIDYKDGLVKFDYGDR